MPPIDPARRAEVIRLRMTGLTYQAIHEELGMPLGTVSAIISKHRNDGKQDGERLTDELQRVADRRASDALLQALAKAFGPRSVAAVSPKNIRHRAPDMVSGCGCALA